MAGTIKHKWNGTVLTITSDAGTSSCDLKGKKGDRGVRGAQGRSGVILKEDGSVDMTGYATEQYVDEQVAAAATPEVDLSGYYTREEIDASMENYTTKEDVEDAIAESPRYTYDMDYNNEEDPDVGKDALVFYEILNEGTSDEIKEIKRKFTIVGGSGGGGGGSTNNADMSLKNTTGWTYKTVAEGATCIIKGNWSSVEDGLSTGDGTLTLYVNNAIKMSKNVAQGDFELDITQYLSSGTNKITVKVVDVYSNPKTIAFTINKLSLTIRSTFNDAVAYSGSVTFTYIPTGNATKTVYFKLNGETIGTKEVTASGRQQSFVIPAQPHGVYPFEVYFTAEVDGETVPSNHLYFDIMFVEAGNSKPLISCSYNETGIEQYETINIPYVVYSPATLTSDIVLKANGEVVSELTVDRKQQVWNYRVDQFGENTLTITCGSTTKTIKFTAAKSAIEVEAVTEDLELYLTSYGRSNNETNPAEWAYEDIECMFSGYNWVSDGWMTDEDGITVHRVGGDARLIIPLQMFKEDFRTTGKTIEFEFRTRNVKNYDAEIINCYSDDIGFSLTAQMATLKSEQSELYTQYKEDEHIRVAFVVEKKAENRLLLIYLNGIMSGAVQYPTDDDFSQKAPVNITIGHSECTIDLYNIRVYNNNLNEFQIVDNWIADTQDIALKLDRYTRNNIFDAYGDIVIDNLPATLPYMILSGAKLPEYKGNKLDFDGEFVNPMSPNKSFTFKGAELDIQGTSSAGYKRKNYKIKFKNGITQNGVKRDKYQMKDTSIPADVFCFKADVASSEGANNVQLVRIYNDACPYKTPPQLVNPNIRQGIDGFGMVIFHDDGDSIKFIGKFNFNDEKSSHSVFGFTDGDESWELKNNTSDRVIWKSADFSGDDWKNDFEARFPDKNENTVNLEHFAQWVVSTDRDQATNTALAAPVTYGGVEYIGDTPEYRLAKFKAELSQYAEVDSALFFYLISELYLAIDNRAKNTFPSLIGGSKIVWLPYDWDSCLGCDNVGGLKFDYSLEDTDTLPSGAKPYNGQDSVFWCNLRDSYGEELQTMYQQLRSDNKISYEGTENAFRTHQAVFPESVWNQDAYYKYISPLIEDGAGIYLPMLQGSKAEQRKWWLYNRFRYIDSKYNAGDALKDFITLRGYAKSDITVTPYADIYTTIKYGSYLVQKRALRGNSYTLECPLDNVNDTEIYIYSASQLKDVGDLSGLQVGLADFSMADKLQNIKLGDADPNYSNGNLESLTLGNNTLLKTLDVRNCTALGTAEQQSLDVSGCTNIEEIYCEGTAIKGITLPDGGVLKTLHLPDTISNLSVCNQTALTDFVLNDPSNISTLRLENMDDVIPAQRIVEKMAEGGRIRIINANMTLAGYEMASIFFNKLDTMRGLDENGNNVSSAQISGKFRVTKDCESYVPDWQAKYPDATFEIWEPVLEDISWSQINQLAQLGLMPKLFPVGSEKKVTLSTGETFTAIILDYDKDSYYDYSTGARIYRKVTFGTKNCMSTTCINDMDYRGYGVSSLRTEIMKYFDYLPTDLQEIIKSPDKEFIYYYQRIDTKSWHSNSSISTSKLFALAHHEIMGVRQIYVGGTYKSWFSDYNPDDQYEYFKMAPIPEGMYPAIDGATTGTYHDGVVSSDGIYYNAHAIKYLGDDEDLKMYYDTRSISLSTLGNALEPDSEAFYIRTNGSASVGSNTTGVAFGFCI